MSIDPVCIDDFEQHAKRFLPKMYWKYYSGGSDAMITLKESKNAFKRYRIAPINKRMHISIALTIMSRRNHEVELRVGYMGGGRL